VHKPQLSEAMRQRTQRRRSDLRIQLGIGELAPL
jgi:hypothetical protein